jgi:hypothetical protein
VIHDLKASKDGVSPKARLVRPMRGDLAVARQKTDEESVVSAQSGLLAHFLDQGYVATQVLAIRRLLDSRKDVFSLRRLLDNITTHQHLITREIYVCNDGLPYDSEAWQSVPLENPQRSERTQVILLS